MLLHILHCPLSGPDPTYISPLNIFCIIEYVTNKQPFYPLLSAISLLSSSILLNPSILFSPPLSCVYNTFWLFNNNALTSNADGNVILLTCSLSALLLYPSLSLWASGTVSLRSTKQILFLLLLPKLHLSFWAWLRPGFVRKTPQPLLRSLTTSPSLTPPSG